MSEYRCSQCGTLFAGSEYRDLEHVPVDEDEPKLGFEALCECGARFHSDKWQLVDEVTVDGEEFHVSTAALLIAHGPDHGDWFETCVFHDSGSRIADRYATQDEAETGHEERLRQLEGGDFGFRPTGRQLVIGDE